LRFTSVLEKIEHDKNQTDLRVEINKLSKNSKEQKKPTFTQLPTSANTPHEERKLSEINQTRQVGGNKF
jgi:hypothetical protein